MRRVVVRGCIKGMGRHLDLSKNHFKKHFTQKIDSIGTPWTGKLKLLRPAKTAVLGRFWSILDLLDRIFREGGKISYGTASKSTREQ